MPFIVDKEAVDSPSTTLCCIYPAQALEGETVKSTNVFFQGDRVEFYVNGTSCSDVGCSRTPIPDPPCITPLTQPLKRVIITDVNKSVFINKKLCAVQGDKAQGLSTLRPIVGPFKYQTINFSNRPV
jgi:hypothetical protein